MGFTQIRFYYFKKIVGRVLLIMTNRNAEGENAVRFFTDSDSDVRPRACNSFTRLPDDNSTLAQKCEKWGYFALNSWGHSRYSNEKHVVFVLSRAWDKEKNSDGTIQRIIFEIILNPCLSPKIKVLVVVPVFRARFCTSNAITALFYIVVQPTAVFGDHAKSLVCRDNREEHGFALVGHDYRSESAHHFGHCFFECSSEEKCQSVTYLWDQKECRLNKETKKSRPEDFIDNAAATYMENNFRAKKGSKSLVPGYSCQDILTSGDAEGDGEY
ncbi:unnamed protein product [Pocillopora meandrina]|uniref:Apple domain-containing protein n=1 Tax=Pocillopora meandrina TaxID=46732 RepID=A0AAU9VTV9_9CNID|nr:unnamed protein product [Pocillopora meandrina]